MLSGTLKARVVLFGGTFNTDEIVDIRRHAAPAVASEMGTINIFQMKTF